MAKNERQLSKAPQPPAILGDTPGLSIHELTAKARSMKRKYSTELIIADYIQLMSGAGEQGRQLQIENISRGLKALAVNLNVPVIALSQFSRPPKGSENHRPVLSDLRDSVALEQDANLILFIHDPNKSRKREHLKTLNIPLDSVDVDEFREIIIAANRQGPTWDILVKWQDQYFSFGEVQ